MFELEIHCDLRVLLSGKHKTAQEKNLTATMEDDKHTNYFSIQPPRLEDAGLEDPALPLEGIQEAFRRVANLVQTKAGVSVRVATPCEGTMEDTVVDPVLEPDDDGKSCVDTATGGPVPSEDAIVVPPDQSGEDLVLEKGEKGPKLGKEKCMVGDTDPTRDTRNL